MSADCVGPFPSELVPRLNARADPVLDWGNPETPQAFLDVVLRRNFWRRAWMESPADVLPIVRDYVASVPIELGWAGAALAAIGVATAFRRRWPVVLIALLLAANLAAVAVHGSRHDVFTWHRCYIPFARAMAAAPDDEVLFYNVGLVYRQHGLLDEAAAAFARAHAINQRGLPSRGRPRAADRIAEIDAARENRAAPPGDGTLPARDDAE